VRHRLHDVLSAFYQLFILPDRPAQGLYQFLPLFPVSGAAADVPMDYHIQQHRTQDTCRRYAAYQYECRFSQFRHPHVPFFHAFRLVLSDFPYQPRKVPVQYAVAYFQ